MGIYDDVNREAGRQKKLFPPPPAIHENEARRKRRELVDYFVQQQRERTGIPSDLDPAINPDANLNRNFWIPRELHGGGGRMYEGSPKFTPTPTRREENWQRALDMLSLLMPGGFGKRVIKDMLPLLRGSKKVQLPLFKRKRRKGEEEIDPAEYERWSDEVSKNAPDPTPENLIGHTNIDRGRYGR